MPTFLLLLLFLLLATGTPATAAVFSAGIVVFTVLFVIRVVVAAFFSAPVCVFPTVVFSGVFGLFAFMSSPILINDILVDVRLLFLTVLRLSGRFLLSRPELRVFP